MTATLPRRSPKPGQRRPRDPDKNYVQCPECGVPTWTFEAYTMHSRPLPAAAGYEDGARCKEHTRTETDRADESARALNIALYRRGREVPLRNGRIGFVAIDDMAQGAE